MRRRQTRTTVLGAALAALLLAPAVATGGSVDASAAEPGGNPFGAQSFWRTPLRAAPVDADSRVMVDYMVGEITDRYGGVAAFNAHQYNSTLYTVDSSTPGRDVAFNDCQQKGYIPSGLTGPDGYFTKVPIPAAAVTAIGTDGELSVYSKATDQLWEFWVAQKHPDGHWSACWGGRLDHVSTSAGAFPGQFGATATSLPNAGGLVRHSEIVAGRIDHMMSLAIPNPAIWSRFRWPAQRSDGSDTNAAALPEGSRLRLDPSVDVTRLGLTPAGVIIARAAQEYGFVVVDKSGSVSVLAEAKPAADASSPDPWRTLLGGPDYAVLKNFPWSRMQVVADGWRGPGTSTTSAAPVRRDAASSGSQQPSARTSSTPAGSASSPTPHQAHSIAAKGKAKAKAEAEAEAEAKAKAKAEAKAEAKAKAKAKAEAKAEAKAKHRRAATTQHR